VKLLHSIATFGCLALIALACSNEQITNQTLFKRLPTSETGVEFNNQLSETEDFNIIEYLYFYNGSGVAIGDINEDGLPDLYFSSNQSTNKLYLNRGDFKFEDITQQAGVTAEGNWKTGVAMADINADGLLDIFSCGVGNYKKFNSRNQVFINQGNSTFVEMANDLGLAFQGFSTHVAFLDYDRDGDLDIYLLNHSVHSVRSYGDVSLRNQSDRQSGDKLYENQLVPKGKTFFEEVTSRAGIHNSPAGYGLGVGISDVNNDGWPDIYVSNDFHENDYLYLNNQDKTFRQVAEKSFAHTSRFSMGNDVADINNDGFTDIITLDMLPKDEQVRKASAGEDPYEIFQYKLKFGHHVQLARNALQLNRGVDQTGNPLFSDIAPFAGMEATDWSWAPLLADFDNDGLKDLFVANGIRRRPNDMDYVAFISNDSLKRNASYQEFLSHMPEGKVADVFFRNKDGLVFEDVSKSWTGDVPDFSNGAAYADLDNDGDLDLVLNHINQNASIYQNQRVTNNFLNVKLVGSATNPFAVGAKMIVYDGERIQTQELYPSRGWQSSVDYSLHVGLGLSRLVDSIKVIWPDGTYSVRRNVNAGKVEIRHSDNSLVCRINSQSGQKSLLKEIQLIDFKHRENDFSEFEIERLIPHSLAKQGPCLAVGDLNNDTLDDVFIGGAAGQSSSLFFQNALGKFVKSKQLDVELDSAFEDTDAIIEDFNSDGRKDLLVVNGGNQFQNERVSIRLYIQSKGAKLVKSVDAFPKISIETSCVRAVDFDDDGDLDIFIGARNVLGAYGLLPESHLFINDGLGQFTKTENVLPASGKLGMVTDAQWTDLNNDKQPDLLVVGDWMTITVLLQEEKKLVDQTSQYGLTNMSGWWNCLELVDLDKDGDLDLVAGNAGENSRLKASVQEPLQLYVADIDNNGSPEQIMTWFNQGVSYPFITRDQLVKQVPSLKKKFLRYQNFKSVGMNDLIGSVPVSILQAVEMRSGWFENSKNNFVFHSFPPEAQFFPVMATYAFDWNKDGKPDIMLGGNQYAVQPEIGQNDAGYGMIMLGDGNGQFSVLPVNVGLPVSGEIRNIKVVNTQNPQPIVIVGINNSSVRSFRVE
jgi:hypothetical protein